MQGVVDQDKRWGYVLHAVWLAAALLAVLVLVFAPGAGLLRLAAGWLLLCLVPGVAISLLLDRRADLFEQAVLGAALSPAAVSVLLYLLAGLLRLPFTLSLMIAGLVFAILLAVSCLRRGHLAVSRPTVPAILVFAAMLLFAGLVTLFFVSRPASVVGPHGLFHTAIIQQIINGIIPPHNIHLYGAPTAYQWPCYFLPATGALLTKASPPVIAAMLRVSTFFGIFGMGYLMARQLGQGAAGRALSALFTALGMNLLGGIHYLAVSLVNPELRYALFQGLYNSRLPSLFSPGVIPEYLQLRTSTLTLKLVNFSFILPGYVVVMVALFGLILVLQGRGRKGYPLVFLGTLGALLIHPLLAAVLAFPLPLALGLLRLIRRGAGPSLSWGRVFALAGCLAAAGLAALPYLIPEMRTSGGTGVSTDFSFDILLSLLWVYAPLGLLAGFRVCNRSWPVSPAERLLFLLAVCNAAFITVQQLKCEWYMLYLTAVPLGLLAGDAAGRWYERTSRAWLRLGALVLLILLAFSGPLLRLNCRILVHLPFEGRYRLLGEQGVRLADQESDLARAYGWIRKNTRPEDLLVEWPSVHSQEELAALTGRRIFVGRPSVHTPSREDPRMSAALDGAQALFDPAQRDKSGVIDQLAALPETTYIVLTRRFLQNRLLSLSEILSSHSRQLELCFDLPEAKIYRVLRNVNK